MRKKLAVLGMVLLALTGCASKNTKMPDAPKIAFDEADPAVMELNEAALRLARASEQAALSMSVGGQARQNTPATTEFKIDFSRLPQELRDPVLLEQGFHGELEVFVRSLADLMAWSVSVVGNKPTVPILVSMSEQRRAPAEWLADAGYQAGGQADVILNPSIKQAVVKYKD